MSIKEITEENIHLTAQNPVPLDQGQTVETNSVQFRVEGGGKKMQSFGAL